MDYALCRLCLNVNNEQTMKLSDDSDILRIIRSCLSIDLTINEAFPNHICKGCIHKIEEINEFCSTIKENERQLQQHFKNGYLPHYFFKLSNIYIKEESNVQNSDVQKPFKDEDSMNNRLANTLKEENDNIDKTDDTELIKDKINNMPHEPELVKDKEVIDIDFNEHRDYSSEEEDNIKLSSLKDQNQYRENETDKKYKENTNMLNASKEVLAEPFNCLTCAKVCDSHNKLREHYKKEHTNKSDDITKPTFTEIVSDGKTMYKCDKCEKNYPKKYIKRHMFYHTNERPYICKLCGRTYKVVSEIMRHGIRAHSGLKLLCSFKCGFSTSYSGSLKEHENKIHKNAFKYTCSKCGKGFTVKTWYEQHQNVHTGLKPFVCEICGVAFHMDKYLTSHRSTLHPQSKAKKPLICLHCDLKCDSANALALHLENEHGVIRNKGKRKRKTLCDFCGKILNRPEQLVIHRRMHLGEKPFKCSACPASFPRACSLAAHVGAHAGARAHACAHAHCGKRYSQPSALYRHQRLHHGLSR